MKTPSIDTVGTIVWDLDNTPWDWVGYAAKTYPAMRDLLVRWTGKSRELITECMRRFYQRAGTIESSWLVQDLERQGLFAGNEHERRKLIKALQRIFHECRQKYLRFFHGFPGVFEQAAQNGVRNLIHTDAPVTHAASRIRHLKLDQGLFSGMIAMPDSLPKEVPGRFQTKSDRERYGLQFPVQLADQEKPHTDLASLLHTSADEIGEHFAFVGDNYGKDMAQAARFGSLGIHARWGKASRADTQTVAEFSGRQIANRNSDQGAASAGFPNIVPAEHPMEIARILGWRQI